MSLIIIISIVSITLIAGYDWYLKNIRITALKTKKSQKPKLRNKKSKDPSEQYRCVALVNKASSCQAAKKLQSKLILMNEAAALPLRQCDQSKCNCAYKRYEDRRMHDRRQRFNMASVIVAKAQKNRRLQSDRRKPKNEYSPRLDQQTISLN